ncbi:MAG: hypothetical protein HPY66_2055 [Firmicutes bacterium]|nr:hypothetical protein [Bacillota bacterium]
MEYNELFEKYQKLLEENQRLEAGMMSMQKGGKTKRVNRGILLYV